MTKQLQVKSFGASEKDMKRVNSVIKGDFQEFTIFQVPIAEIDLDDDQFKFRYQIDEDDLSELVESIKETRQINPVILRKKNEKYQIVAGFRRVTAKQLAGAETVDAIVIGNLPDDLAYKLSFDENMKRKSLSRLEIALMCERLNIEHKKTYKQISEILGIGEKSIQLYIRVLTLTDKAKQALHKDELPFSHAFLIAKLEPEVQDQIIDRIKNENLSRENLINLIKAQRKRKVEKVQVPKDLKPKIKIDTREKEFRVRIGGQSGEEIKSLLKRLLELIESGEVSFPSKMSK